MVGENGILVIPSVNNMSMDFGKRFWISDDTDLNRLFPGNPSGESGSRVAYAIMETTRGYRYGIHLPSFYLGGTFMPICADFPMLLKQKADRLTEQHYITTGKEMEQKHFLYTQE